MSPQEIVDCLTRHGVDPNDVFNANGDLLENDKGADPNFYYLFSCSYAAAA